MNHEYYWIMYLSHILIFVILIRTEKMLEDSGDTVQPPPRAGSSLVASGGRPVCQAARISCSDMVIEEGESEGNTDSTYQSESQDSDLEDEDLDVEEDNQEVGVEDGVEDGAGQKDGGDGEKEGKENLVS
jgi:hypothetical protein